MKYTPRLPEKNVNVSETSLVKEFFILVSGILGTCLGIYFLLGFSVDMIVSRITPGIEHKLASYIMDRIGGTHEVLPQSRAVQSLLESLQHECAAIPYTLKVHIQKNPAVNAAALPGGNIVVFTGLLDKVGSENELAFVLSHEIGHFVHRDHLKGLGRGLVFMTISAIMFGADSRVGQMIGGAVNLTELSYSRKQETQADEFGADILNCHYGHVAGVTDFFQKLLKENPGEKGFAGHYLSTHPETNRRIQHLEDYCRSRGFAQKDLQKLPDFQK